ncbi:MAG TPA: 8-oxo-dGTP diphosphatase [Candidatus Saccharibacteria bacterium]|nr:8-oxo-dGTP diphosphatase [Candidatus Saccharibacteria bacterium]
MKKINMNLLFLTKKNQVLLALKKRGFGANRYNGIGGKIELNETVEEALIRESQEEIGVTPLKFEKMANIVFDEYFKGEPTLVEVDVYIASKWTGKPTESEEVNPKWFKINQIPFDQMWPDDLYWLPQVLDGKKISAKFKLDEKDTIISRKVKIVNRI